ncbi:MAG: hypothetical protein ACOY0R_11800 [Chloroflexota bacterium]
MPRINWSRCLAVPVLLSLLVSCSGLKSANTPFPAINPTAIAAPTLSAMYYGPEPTTDGQLSLEVEDTEEDCYPLKSRIPIKFTFRNLSDEPVTFPLFIQDGMGLKPILTSQTLYIYHDPETPRDFVYPRVKELVTLSPSQSFESTYWYQLPDFLFVYVPPGEVVASTPTAGKYLLKFIFQNHDKFDANAWRGRIASNRIEVCIME